MKKDQSDQALSFKKRARRRLVGAIALVLLMIILLPMILEDRAVPEQQEEIAITIENELPFDDANASDFDSSIMAEGDLDEEASDLVLAEMLEDAPVELALPKQAKLEPLVSERKEKVVAKTKQDTKPKDKSTPKSAVAAISPYYVQVGVYSDAANVKQLQTRLNDLGYESKTEVIIINEAEKIRLITTVFPDKNEAIIALQNIKGSGLTGMVLKQK